MVSRGGRSKGCSNCRRRRVKCDEKQTCTQCAKRGLECDGPKDLTWIDQSQRFPTKEATENAVAKLRSPEQLSYAAFEQDMCLAYTRKYLLRGGAVELACEMIDSTNDAVTLKDPGRDLLRKAIISLSMTFFGRQHHQSRIINKGYHHYGEVLQQLNAHLTQPELHITNETILTALSCMFLEIFLPTGPTNFMKHQRGIEAMMKLRGPPTKSDGSTATIYRGLRILSIVGSLAESRPSIWASNDWKQALDAQTTEAGILQHELFNILADCTHLVGQRDALLASTSSPEDYRAFLHIIEALNSTLIELYPKWEQLNQNQFAQVQNPSRIAKEIGVANHVSATAYMLYNTALVFILRIKESLIPSADDMALRETATCMIVKCLELREDEKREGALQSNTITDIATKVGWHALVGLGSSEARRLDGVVDSAFNEISSQPQARLDFTLCESSKTPDGPAFAQYVEKVLTTNPDLYLSPE